MTEVVSPIPGTFYRKPSPDKAPYVEIGDEVTETSVLCLVEVMKTFNEIQAGVKGKIKEIRVENEAFVNAGDVLFVIE